MYILNMKLIQQNVKNKQGQTNKYHQNKSDVWTKLNVLRTLSHVTENIPIISTTVQ